MSTDAATPDDRVGGEHVPSRVSVAFAYLAEQVTGPDVPRQEQLEAPEGHVVLSGFKWKVV
jgi:hypothetical protein